MSESWSNNPNAPRIPSRWHPWEKAYFVGYLVGSIFHGIVIALFFQCLIALLNPTNRTKGGIRWGLVVHSAALFLNATVSLAIGLYILSLSYIDDREFPGADGQPPGPFGYGWPPQFTALNVISASLIPVNQWLVDGLLLYRSYVLYGMNYWAVAFPFTLYLASWAAGIGFIYTESTLPYDDYLPSLKWGNAYFSIALSLNVLLTLMIAARLVLHVRSIRNIMRALDRASGLYKTIIATLVESGVLYAVSFLLLVGPWASRSVVQFIALQILPEIQVIAPLLLVLRLANRTALVNETVTSGNVSSIRFNSQENSTGGDGSIHDGETTATTNEYVGASGERGGGAGGIIEQIQR